MLEDYPYMNLRVDKLVVTLSQKDEDKLPIINDKIADLDTVVNRKLSDLLLTYKNMINYYNYNRSWDKHKKYSNEYEYIYSSPTSESNISVYTPVSRSFFKMWEILHDFKEELHSSSALKCMFLCEGPGGFAEAIMKFRNNSRDEYYGMTLRGDNNRTVPDWKLNGHKLNIIYGLDGTGNIYNIQNIKYLIKMFKGKNSVDFITADGGFDFSSDFNNQEDMCVKLIASEILSALYLQKPDGNLILKVFDMFNENTIKLLHVLYESYEAIHIVKPCTSRPANSEKYLICKRFKPPSSRTKQFIEGLEIFIKEDNFSKIPIHQFNKHLMNHLVRYNTYGVMKQIQYIQKTIDMIKNPEIKTKNILNNIHVCQDWCKKYGIASSNADKSKDDSERI